MEATIIKPPVRYPHQAVRLVMEYTNNKLPVHVRKERYVGHTDKKETTIEDMNPAHAKNAIAYILRMLKLGYMAYVDHDGIIRFA